MKDLGPGFPEWTELGQDGGLELFKQFSDNPEFKRWLTDTVFAATFDRPMTPAP